MDQGRIDIRRKESVCRCLFGPVNHEQVRQELKLKLKEIVEQDSRRWNFDFQSETPLPGRYQWEEIPTICAAALYHDSTQPRDVCSSNTDSRSDHDESSGADQENCSSISNTRKCPAEVTPVRRKRTFSKSAAKPTHDTQITGEKQSLFNLHPAIHLDSIKRKKKCELAIFVLFLGRVLRKKEEDDRNKKRPASFPYKFH